MTIERRFSLTRAKPFAAAVDSRRGSAREMLALLAAILSPVAEACRADTAHCLARGAGAMSSAVDGGSAGPSTAQPNSEAGCSPVAAVSAPIGWASVSAMGENGTTGGSNGRTVRVSTLSDLNSAVSGTAATIVWVSGVVTGNVDVGSNKTIVGLCGAEIHGHLQISDAANVIVRNLRIVGYNCADSPSDCSAGADAVTVERAHHLWFDHDDISDGSDGNLDVTHGADFITVSWTKFHYSCQRVDPAGASGGHQFSNLVGHSDSNGAEDAGHLNVTFHHDWWAANVVERMPRVRFGQVHIFDCLYTSTGDDYCIGVGANANIRDENNAFIGVNNPIDASSYSNGASVIGSSGNLEKGVTGTAGDRGGAPFMPPYVYALDDAASVPDEVMARCGPQ